MKILFNSYFTNLGNTGGCKTIIRSADTLRALGHDVTISAQKNRYTWSKVKTVKKIPKADVNIAVSVMDIDSTLQSKAKHKAIWLRGWEKWLMPKEEMIKKLRKIRVIVNSSWLIGKLAKHGIKAELCWAGLDLEEWNEGN